MWQDLKDTVKSGLREVQELGDELTRQGRLRMDIFQAERREQAAARALGETVYAVLADGKSVSPADDRIAELVSRVSYYQDELKRLKSELHEAPVSA